ncbi:MAG: cache domain-containing protein [Candidatus Kerfeldbacteria bacterium]
MTVFFFEYVFFIVSIFAILVSVSSAALFLLTYEYEKQLRTIWRAAGFFLLAIAFLIYIIERKYYDVELVGVIAITVEMIGLYSIYKGVRAEPILSQLAGKQAKIKQKDEKPEKGTSTLFKILAVIILVALIPINYFFTSYVASLFYIVSIVVVLLTIRIQVQRYQQEKDDPKMRRQNLWPLLAYIFLLFRLISLIFFRLPELNIVFFRQLTQEYSIAWQLGAFYTFVAFILLAIWAWNFIKLRKFLRSYVVFLTITIVVSTLGSLVFSLLVFRIVEENNLQLMQQAAETEELIMQDRSNTAVFFSQLIADDANVIDNLVGGNYPGLFSATDKYLQQINVDRIRVYSKFGEVVACPTDQREEGQVFNDDNLLSFSLLEKRQIQSFDTAPGVLTPVLITRAIQPIILNNEVVGAVEVSYFFDNAFVDFSQSVTGLDVTMYTGSKRSATTIYTLDGVSRWVGSEETEQNVIEDVLTFGGDYRASVDRLGVEYYSAFKPVRDVNGVIIGMVSVGTPTVILIQDTRQQLVNTFLIVTLVSLAAAFLGYAALSKASRRTDSKQ